MGEQDKYHVISGRNNIVIYTVDICRELLIPKKVHTYYNKYI